MELRTVSFFSEAYSQLISGVKVLNFMKKRTLEVKDDSENFNRIMKQKRPNTESVDKVVKLVKDVSANVDRMLPDVKSCSFCNVDFPNRTLQRQHYKLDWHRYNLELNLKQRKPITEEDFTCMAVADDVSSISGSDSETEDETESNVVKDDDEIGDLISKRMRIILKNESGNFLSFSRCWFTGSKGEIPSETELITAVQKLPTQSQIMVVMLGGGHFAASIFRKTEPILHKTFHSYTVRAKQGGSQSVKDNKQSASKSAGASLRRYNERSFMQHVQEILANWSKDIASCDFIFLRAVGPNNQSVLFSGKHTSLDKSDVRIRKIPFPTRRPTFNETRRVHALLTSFDIYQSKDVFFSKFLDFSSKVERENKNKSCVDNSKCQTLKKNKSTTLPPKVTVSKAVDQLVLSSDSREADEEQLEIRNVEVEESSKEQSRKVKKKKKKVENCKEPEPEVSETVLNFRKDVLTEVTLSKAVDQLVLSSDSREADEEQLEISNVEVAESSKDQNRKFKKKKKKVENCKEPEPEVPETILNFRKDVLTACTNGNLETLEDILKRREEIISDEDVEFAMNQTTPDELTLLQLAAKKNFKEIVQIILLNGGDPCVKNAKSMTAYDLAGDKETRNVFRQFMGDYPERHDYSKSHIPSALTEDVKERQRAVKKAKRIREKERKKVDEGRKQEIAEQKRFLQLDDREKRALAAERRIQASLGKSGQNLVLQRCYRCAINITGKVPFHYESYNFCSMPCLKEHRQDIKTVNNNDAISR